MAGPEVAGVGVVDPESVVGVDADRTTRVVRDALAPNLLMRSDSAVSMAAVAAASAVEEEEFGGSTEGEEGGGEGEVEVERPGIEARMEDHEKLTAGLR